MKSTSNRAVRTGITKSRSGHYAVWCSGCATTINHLPLDMARKVRARLALDMAGKPDKERREVFLKEARTWV